MTNSNGNNDDDVNGYRNKVKRFLSISEQLPVELKIILCHRCYRTSKACIQNKDWLTVLPTVCVIKITRYYFNYIPSRISVSNDNYSQSLFTSIPIPIPTPTSTS
jgi:hypothetical protein